MHFDANKSFFLKTHLKVANIVDGDGLIVTNIFNKDPFEVRLYGIDAPEIKRCRKLAQDEREVHIAGELLIMLGKMAHRYILDLVSVGTLITLAQERQNHTDKYGRTLGYVILPCGKCLNELLISGGYAKPYNLHYCSELSKYQELNKTARLEAKGLYSYVSHF